MCIIQSTYIYLYNFDVYTYVYYIYINIYTIHIQSRGHLASEVDPLGIVTREKTVCKDGLARRANEDVLRQHSGFLFGKFFCKLKNKLYLPTSTTNTYPIIPTTTTPTPKPYQKLKHLDYTRTTRKPVLFLVLGSQFNPI